MTPPRRVPPRFRPAPPPGAADESNIPLPPLPRSNTGRPPGGGPPRLGRMGMPPEIRRQIPGAIRGAPGALMVADRIRTTLEKAQRKLLQAQQRLKRIAGQQS